MKQQKPTNIFFDSAFEHFSENNKLKQIYQVNTWLSSEANDILL